MSVPFAVFQARLADKHQHNEKFYQLHFELVAPNRIEFLAGQYVIMTVPGTDHKKSYSICSSPAVDHEVELLIDITPMGPGSQYALNIKPGDVATFMAPFGNFVVADRESPIGQNEKSLIFVATGSGIAPMMGILEDLLLTKHDERPMILYWGLRHAEDQFWFDEFELLAKSHPNFTFHPVLSQAPEDWPLCRGRVTDCLRVHAQPAQAGYYLCGRDAMINDVLALVQSQGITPEHIHHERFT